MTLKELMSRTRNKVQELERRTEASIFSDTSEAGPAAILESEQSTKVLMYQELGEILAALYREPWFSLEDPAINIADHEIPSEIAARVERLLRLDFTPDSSSQQKPS